MKMSARCSLLLVAAVAATTGVAATAHAQTFNPDFEFVDGQLRFPLTMDYDGSTTIECTGAGFSGVTGTDSDSFEVDFDMTGLSNCDVSGLSATTICDGPVRLIALNATLNEATLDLLLGFDCDIEVQGVCTISIEGPQDPFSFDSVVSLFNEGWFDPTLEWDVEVVATRTGSPLCGPSTGPIAISALFDVTPNNFSID